MIPADFTTQRARFSPGDMLQAVTGLSEGNPGAAMVLMELAASYAEPAEAFVALLDLDDMNMRGAQIHVAFKYYCEGDHDRFRAAIQARDPAMVEFVNAHRGVNPAERAVTSGASFRHL